MVKKVDRKQIRYMTLEDFIKPDSEVRIIDAFVEALDLKAIGIEEDPVSKYGRPKAAEKRDLLKLQIYGARNQMDSCRDMEKACTKDVEVMWLMYGQAPKHTVISDFNLEMIPHYRQLFYLFTDLMLHDSGIDYQSVDGSKFKANNAKDANFTRMKLDDRIKWKTENLQDYERRMRKIRKDYNLPKVAIEPYSGSGKKETEPEKESLKQAKDDKRQIDIWELVELFSDIEKTMDEDEELEKECKKEEAEKQVGTPLEEAVRNEAIQSQTEQDSASELTEAQKNEFTAMEESVRKKQEILGRYLGYRKYMEEHGLSQLSLTDPDSKLMKSKNGFMVAYNMQASIDAESHMITEYLTTSDPADIGQLHPLLTKLKERYSDSIIQATADKGYQSVDDMAKCLEDGIIPHVILENDQDFYEVEFMHEPGIITESDKKSTDAQSIKRCLRAGEIPDVYKKYLSFVRIYEKRIFENEVDPNSHSGELTDEQMMTVALTGYYVRDLTTDRVYCPQGEILRKKSERKDGAVRYANKFACKKCPARKSGYCTTAEFKEVTFPDKKIFAKCTKWPDVEYVEELKDENQNECTDGVDEGNASGSESAAKKDEKPVSFKVPRIRRKMVGTETRVVMKLTPDRDKMSARFGLSEHPFGSLKVGLRRDSFSVRGRMKVDGEYGLSCLAYNLVRAYNKFGYAGIMEKIRNAHHHCSSFREPANEEQGKNS